MFPCHRQAGKHFDKTNKESKGLKARGLSKHIGVLPNNFDSEERKSSRGGRKAPVQEQSRRRRHAKRRLEERESSRTNGQVEMLATQESGGDACYPTPRKSSSIIKTQVTLESFVLTRKEKAKQKKMTIILLKGRFVRLFADKPVRHLDAD